MRAPQEYQIGYIVDVSLVTCGERTAVYRAFLLAIWPNDA
jgi:hypothetical protein